MEIKVKNSAKGQRGIYAGGELVWIDGGQTGTFTGATKAEAEAAASYPELFVWADGKPLSEEKPQEEKPWLVIARDTDGADMKVIELDGRWMIGMTVASERPKGPQGYTFVKIGGDMSALPESAVQPEPAPEPAIEVSGGVEADQASEAQAVEDAPAPVDLAPTELVEKNAPDVIAEVEKADADRLGAIKAAEMKRPGPARKGVMKAIEDRELDLATDPSQDD